MPNSKQQLRTLRAAQEEYAAFGIGNADPLVLLKGLHQTERSHYLNSCGTLAIDFT